MYFHVFLIMSFFFFYLIGFDWIWLLWLDLFRFDFLFCFFSLLFLHFIFYFLFSFSLFVLSSFLYFLFLFQFCLPYFFPKCIPGIYFELSSYYIIFPFSYISHSSLLLFFVCSRWLESDMRTRSYRYNKTFSIYLVPGYVMKLSEWQWEWSRFFRLE